MLEHKSHFSTDSHVVQRGVFRQKNVWFMVVTKRHFCHQLVSSVTINQLQLCCHHTMRMCDLDFLNHDFFKNFS
jgi:hypothetical protein